MSPTSNMLVRLQDLPVTRVTELSNELVRDVIAGMPTRAILERPADDPDAGHADVTLDLHADDDGNVHLRGKISGWLAVGCSRCIDAVKFPFEEELLASYRPAGTVPGDDGDGDGAGDDDDELGLELSDQELDLYSYEGETIDLERLLREQLVLAVPFAPLCHEDCKGLCAYCGVDKNREQCECQPPIDPRLAKLQDIKL